MSSALYPSCLIYCGKTGIAKRDGKTLLLFDNPTLCGERVLSIYYVPMMCWDIRRKPSSPTHEDMTPEEIAAADALLRELCP